MTPPTMDELLLRSTQDIIARPVAPALADARRDLVAAVADLRTIPDSSLERDWGWTGGSEVELRYGFYRIAEALELAMLDAEAVVRRARTDRGRAAHIIAPATAARWDLHGLLATLPDAVWDADPGGGEWTIRLTMGHIISGQRAYGVGTGWWLEQAFAAGDLSLPSGVPDELWEQLPSDEQEGTGTPAEVIERLGAVLDRATERLAGLGEEHLALGGRWSGFPIDLAFRLGRWSSHIREHTIQVEKTLVMLDLQPTEVDRLIRLVLAAWGRAEAVVYGAAEAGEAEGPLVAAAASARATAAEIATLARS
jgi:hypothetical protein